MPINYEGLANLLEELGREGRPAAEGFEDYLRNTSRDGDEYIAEAFAQLADVRSNLGLDEI